MNYLAPRPYPGMSGFWIYTSIDGTPKIHHAEDIPSDEYAAMSEADRERILGSIAPAQAACPEREAEIEWASAEF